MKILLVTFIILVTYIFLLVLHVFIKQIVKRNNRWRNLLRIVPLIEFITWIIAIFWIINYLFEEKSYYQVIILSLVIILGISLGWFFLKDFVAGVIFRVQNNYTQGETIQVGNITGKIDALHVTHICIYTEEGKTIKVPYSKLNNEIISEQMEISSTEENKFLLKTNKKNSAKETGDTIHNILLNTPWRIKDKLPLIKYISEDNDTYTFEIQVQTRNSKHLGYLSKALSSKFME